MNKKIVFITFYVIAAFALPLMGKIELITDKRIIFLMLATVALLTIQPRVDLLEAKDKKKSDNNSAFVILICSLIGVMAPVIEWAYFKPQASDVSSLTILGVILVISGVIIRAVAIHTLGKYFTTIVQTTAQHQLVKEGMYAVIRHPSYLGTFIGMVGAGIFLQAWIGSIIAAIAILIAYHIRIKAEESELVRSFGQRYIDYQKETRKMIPLVW